MLWLQLLCSYGEEPVAPLFDCIIFMPLHLSQSIYAVMEIGFFLDSNVMFDYFEVNWWNKLWFQTSKKNKNKISISELDGSFFDLLKRQNC